MKRKRNKQYHIVNFCITPTAKEALSTVPKGFKSIVVSRLLEEWARSGVSYKDLLENDWISEAWWRRKGIAAGG